MSRALLRQTYLGGVPHDQEGGGSLISLAPSTSGRAYEQEAHRVSYSIIYDVQGVLKKPLFHLLLEK